MRADGATLVVRFQPRSGALREIEDRLALAPRGEMSTLYGVGRLLRILRAGRVSPPPAPYDLGTDPERAVELVRRCIGAVVELHVRRRWERELILWTEDGVQSIPGVLDCIDQGDALAVSRRNGAATMRIPRAQIVRFDLRSLEGLEIVSVEVPARNRL